MPRPQRTTQSGVGASNWLPTDMYQSPFNASVSVVVTGTPTYSIEHSFDEAIRAAPVNVFAHDTLTGQTVNANGNYAFPVSAVRVNITGGAGTAELTLIQGGANSGT